MGEECIKKCSAHVFPMGIRPTLQLTNSENRMYHHNYAKYLFMADKQKHVIHANVSKAALIWVLMQDEGPCSGNCHRLKRSNQIWKSRHPFTFVNLFDNIGFK